MARLHSALAECRKEVNKIMSLPKVFLTQRIQEPGLSLLEGRVDYRLWTEDGVPDMETVYRDIADADGVLVTIGFEIGEKFFDAAKKLKVVSLYRVGYDGVDIEAATKRGIMVTNTPGVLTDATADTALLLMLMAARRVREAERILRSGEWGHWSPNLFLGRDLTGAALGIIGFGAIGRAVARRALGFDMRVFYTSRTRKPELEESMGVSYMERDDLIRECDYISLNCDLNTSTRGMIGARELKMMKKTAILINTARGAVVDQRALYTACAEGWIYGAGLDTLDVEPVPLDEPLLSLENVVIMPHIGSATVNSRNGMARLAAQNLLDAIEGRRPGHLINPDVLG